jgi:hypothetical protein
MRIGRAIIIPAILALGVAGSTVAGSAIAVAGAHLHPQVAGNNAHPKRPSAAPDIYFHT